MAKPINPDRTAYILKELRDPDAIPAEISWFPETIGWKVLAVVLLVFAIYKSYRFYKWWKKNQYRREALAEISKVDFSVPHKAAQRLSKILKVTAGYALPDKKVNQLPVAELCSVLNNSCDEATFDNTKFAKWQERILRPESKANFAYEETKVLSEAVILWVKQHKAEEKA